MLGEPATPARIVHRWLHSRTFYRLALILPVATFIDSIARLHNAQSFLVFAQKHAAPPGPTRTLLDMLVALVVYGPLAFACWDLGREQMTARRMGALWLAGLREVVRRAFARELTAPEEVLTKDSASHAPRDNRWAALAWSAPIAVLLPAFFEANLPQLRAPLPTVWLIGAGAIMGASIYLRRRAIAYLIDEPSPWAMFSGFKFLDESRYAEPGRVFVRLQKVCMFLLPVWWLGFGMLVITRLSAPVRP